MFHSTSKSNFPKKQKMFLFDSQNYFYIRKCEISFSFSFSIENHLKFFFQNFNTNNKIPLICYLPSPSAASSSSMKKSSISNVVSEYAQLVHRSFSDLYFLLFGPNSVLTKIFSNVLLVILKSISFKFFIVMKHHNHHHHNHHQNSEKKEKKEKTSETTLLVETIENVESQEEGSKKVVVFVKGDEKESKKSKKRDKLEADEIVVSFGFSPKYDGYTSKFLPGI